MPQNKYESPTFFAYFVVTYHICSSSINRFLVSDRIIRGYYTLINKLVKPSAPVKNLKSFHLLFLV